MIEVCLFDFLFYSSKVWLMEEEIQFDWSLLK